ncbi:hypothetical protein [Actinomadura rupiterrae]|uniref:hypothetical protein n=1 Tax=Actinomadura rupiterrae TaxID=559627 RepID=UPI0020A50C88|nr:hypothetical protein [Actinomadura rupiterrae]MCP2336158.1 hypothetical protein [Actinomadura rupiterrae]
MDETNLREALHDLATAPLPPSDRVRISAARARGVRTRRVRRAGAVAAVAATCVAIAGVGYAATDSGSPSNRHNPVAAPGISSGPDIREAGVLSLRRDASFGWLPAGYRESGLSVQLSPNRDRHRWTLSAAGPGFHMGPADAPVRLIVGSPQRGAAVPRDAVRITVNRMHGYWINQPGRGTATLTWALPSGAWATLDVGPEVSKDVPTIIRIALNVRFSARDAAPGAAPSTGVMQPADAGPVRFPARIAGLTKTFQTTGLFATLSGSGISSFGGDLDGGTAPGAKGLSIEVTPKAEADDVSHDGSLARTTIEGHTVFHTTSGYPTYWISDVQGYAIRVTSTPDAFTRLQRAGGIKAVISGLAVPTKSKAVLNPFE